MVSLIGFWIGHRVEKLVAVGHADAIQQHGIDCAGSWFLHAAVRMSADDGPDGFLQGCDERGVGLGVELLIRRDGEADGTLAGERAEDGQRSDVGADGAGVRAVVRLVVEVDAVGEKVQHAGGGIELLGIEGRGLGVVAPRFDEVGLIVRVKFHDAGQLAGADFFIEHRHHLSLIHISEPTRPY